MGGLAAAALIGCGDEDEPAADSGAAPASTQGAGAGAQVQVFKDDNVPYPYTFPEPNVTPKKGGTLRVAITTDFSSLDTTKSASAVTIYLPNIVYNRLLGYVHGTNPKYTPFKLQLEPELAQSWEASPDGMTYTFKLAPNVKWQNVKPLNGRPFTAADVKFTYERYAAEGVNQQYFSAISNIEAQDATTLRITLKRPSPDFLVPLGGFFTSIHPKELVDDGSLAKSAVGTGPMILEGFRAGDSAQLKKNPDYWEREVLLDGLDVKLMLDQAARLASFRAEQLDYAPQIVDSLADLDTLKRSNANIQINAAPLLASGAMGLPADHPKFQDIRVRHALALAIDADTMGKILYPNEAVKRLPVMQWPFVFDKEPTNASGELGKWFKYDAAESKKLLLAAGAENLEFTNLYYILSPVNGKISNLFGEAFRNVGVKMNEQLMEYVAFNSQWVPRQFKEATTGAWFPVGFTPDNFFYDSLHSKGAGNRLRVNDAEIDGWADAQQVELNPQKRRELLRKIWDKELELTYRISYPARVPVDVYQPWLRGLRYDGGNGPSSFFYSLGPQIERVWLNK